MEIECNEYKYGCKYIHPAMKSERDTHGTRPIECPKKKCHCGWFPDSDGYR